MDTTMAAFSRSAQVWEPALLELNGFHAFVFLVYLGAAWLCFINGRRRRDTKQDGPIWLAVATVLFVLGVNSVLQADLLVTQFLRTLSKLQGWYGSRREWQYGTVAVLALVFFVTAKKVRPRFGEDQAPIALAAMGVSGLVLLLALRIVSAHATDAVIQQRVLGVSVGRLLELASISVVLFGAVRNIRLH